MRPAEREILLGLHVAHTFVSLKSSTKWETVSELRSMCSFTLYMLFSHNRLRLRYRSDQGK